MNRKIFLVLLSLALVISLIPRDALSLDYPTREIEVITGSGAGSVVDTVGRLIGKFAEKYIGKPIIVVNMPGGGGARGGIALAKAKPDGYTLGLLAPSYLLQPYLMKDIPFHFKKSFRNISMLVYSGSGLYVKKGGPYDIPLKDLVKKAKEKPNTIKVGLGSTWSSDDFSRAIFEDEAGIKLVRVPFAGGAGEQMTALLGGHTDLSFGASAQWVPFYKGGRVNVIANTIEQRDPRFPDIPTFKESGYSVLTVANFWVAAPAGTPDAITNFLAEAFRKACQEQGYIEGTDKLGFIRAWANPADTLKTLEGAENTYLRVIKKLDLKPE